MAFTHGIKQIVTNGLVLALDAGNPRSYPGSGTTWNNLVGSNSGTLTNGPTFSTSGGGSIVFDGIDDAVVLGTPANINSTYCTVSVWIYPTDLSNTELHFQRSNTRANTVRLRHRISGTSVYSFTITNNSNTLVELSTTSYTTVTNEWVMITGTYDGTTMKLYINDTFNNSTSLSGTIDTTNYSSVTVGNNSGYSASHEGNMAAITYYNRALSASEVLQNYNAIKPRFGL